MNFIIGGLAGSISTFILQPFDFIKVQFQVKTEMGVKNINFLNVMNETYKNRGIRLFYRGIDSAILRQLVYTLTRIGVFYHLNDWYKAKYKMKPTLLANISFAVSCAVVGSFVANPLDLILVRMQSDLIYLLKKEETIGTFFMLYLGL